MNTNRRAVLKRTQLAIAQVRGSQLCPSFESCWFDARGSGYRCPCAAGDSYASPCHATEDGIWAWGKGSIHDAFSQHRPISEVKGTMAPSAVCCRELFSGLRSKCARPRLYEGPGSCRPRKYSASKMAICLRKKSPPVCAIAAWSPWVPSVVWRRPAAWPGNEPSTAPCWI
jgi:hypothetical protein